MPAPANRQAPIATRLVLAAIVALYLLIGSFYAVRTPPWQIPDEPAHYNYIRHLVEQRSLPILQPGDYPFDYLERLKAERFPPELSIDTIRYEAWQPPLYYLLAAPVFAFTNGSLIAIRLFTSLLGSLVILLTFALGRTLWPASSGLALLAAGFIAFVPQHLAMMAAANNDALAEVLIALGLLLALRATLGTRLETTTNQSPSSNAERSHVLSRPHPHARPWIMCGLVLGLAFLTKLSAYPLAAVLAFALLLAARRGGWPARTLARAAALVFVPALLLGGLWWARNLAVYGGLDFLAFARHDLVVQGQPRTSDILALWGARTYLVNFLQTTFQSFWGQFGWMGVVMDRRIYLALLVYSVMLLVGWGGAVLPKLPLKVREKYSSPSGRPWPPQRSGVGGGGDDHAPRTAAEREGELPKPQSFLSANRALSDALTLLGLHAALTLAVYLYYNLSFVQFQGRYLYPALPLVALVAAVALRQWARWLGAFLPARAVEIALPAVPIALMALLALYALYAFILPQLSR
jgi:4-amino-4-deoxy-L-arabinose transferase-like glycosyltransferase